MARLLLDGADYDLPPVTWAQLLDELDRQLAQGGRIVTDVRFDGIDEAAFREPGVLERPLADLAIVEVATGTPESLMHRCLEEAAAAIEPLCRAAMSIADGFRGFDIRGANAGLAELADGLSTLIAIAGAAGLAAKGGVPQAPGSSSHPIGALAGELTGYVDALIEAQQAEDWIAVADLLQYDVEPALRRWAPVFEAVAHPTLPAQASA